MNIKVIIAIVCVLLLFPVFYSILGLGYTFLVLLTILWNYKFTILVVFLLMYSVFHIKRRGTTNALRRRY